jgi:SAM-dependent methyltransferase
MPFNPNFFDKAFCFGVLQHTPDPKKAFFCIVESLKPGGQIVSDIYVKDIIHWLLHPKYWVRPFTRKKNPQDLYKILKNYIDLMWPLAKVIRKIPIVGSPINQRLLIADPSKKLPNAPDAILKEWAYLNTFDMLSPMYDSPQTLKTFRNWHEQANLVDIDVHYGYNGIEGRGSKPK